MGNLDFQPLPSKTLPAGVDLQWPIWKFLNRLGKHVDCCEDNSKVARQVFSSRKRRDRERGGKRERESNQQPFIKKLAILCNKKLNNVIDKTECQLIRFLIYWLLLLTIYFDVINRNLHKKIEPVNSRLGSRLMCLYQFQGTFQTGHKLLICSTFIKICLFVSEFKMSKNLRCFGKTSFFELYLLNKLKTVIGLSSTFK